MLETERVNDEMTNIIPAGLLGIITGSGYFAASVLSGDTYITLKEAIIVFLFTITVVLYQERKNNKICNVLKELRKGQEEIEKHIRHLPCHPLSSVCPNPNVIKVKTLEQIKKLAEEAKDAAEKLVKEETTTT